MIAFLKWICVCIMIFSAIKTEAQNTCIKLNALSKTMSYQLDLNRRAYFRLCIEVSVFSSKPDARIKLEFSLKSFDMQCQQEVTLIQDSTSDEEHKGLNIYINKYTKGKSAKFLIRSNSVCRRAYLNLKYVQYNDVHKTNTSRIAVRLAGGLMSSTAVVIFVIGIACCAVKRRNRLNSNVIVTNRPTIQTTTISTASRPSNIVIQQTPLPYPQNTLGSPPTYEQSIQVPPYPAYGIPSTAPPSYSENFQEKQVYS